MKKTIEWFIPRLGYYMLMEDFELQVPVNRVDDIVKHTGWEIGPNQDTVIVPRYLVLNLTKIHYSRHSSDVSIAAIQKLNKPERKRGLQWLPNGFTTGIQGAKLARLDAADAVLIEEDKAKFLYENGLT